MLSDLSDITPYKMYHLNDLTRGIKLPTTEGLYYYKAKGVSVLQSVDVSSVKGSLINLKCDSLVSFYAACNFSLYESRVCS